MLEDPRLNFAISTLGHAKGIDHLGIQADDEAELAQLKMRAQAADQTLVDEGETLCCYSRSEKHWVTDPQGIAWEHYRTLESAQVYGKSRPLDGETSESACCAAAPRQGKPIRVPVKSASSSC
jgi:hypothetical protein